MTSAIGAMQNGDWLGLRQLVDRQGGALGAVLTSLGVSLDAASAKRIARVLWDASVLAAPDTDERRFVLEAVLPVILVGPQEDDGRLPQADRPYLVGLAIRRALGPLRDAERAALAQHTEEDAELGALLLRVSEVIQAAEGASGGTDPMLRSAVEALAAGER